MFGNKHVVAALIITPILAIISYFAVDMMVSETPHVAKSGGAYQLVEKPNCRYSSGQCGLKNGEFEIKLTAKTLDDGSSELILASKHALEAVMIATYDKDLDDSNDTQPAGMKAQNKEKTEWSIRLPVINPGKNRIQVAITSNQVMYYGDVGTQFYDYETAFKKDFR